MALKNYKPYTPSRRFMIWYDFSDITTNHPEKSLIKSFSKTAWRNNTWRTTSRFRWGWHKKLYRLIDFRWYDKLWIEAKVVSIEYDPYRTSRIALLSFIDWEKRYVLSWKWIQVGEKVVNWPTWSVKSWNRKQLKDIPEWVNIFNLEVVPNTKWKLVKSAWSFATIVGKDELQKFIFVKLQSWEVRKFNESCRATVGELWNEQHQNVVVWKAWRVRRKWRKPHILWKSMNPCDHPHWWWEWHTQVWSKKWPKTSSGRLVTPWIKTRNSKKWSTRFIVSKRVKN